jgi:hypothetical protein
MLLTATALGLQSGPTAALNDEACEKMLDLNKATQAVLYVVLIGRGQQPDMNAPPDTH